jgi:uncharacterized protein
MQLAYFGGEPLLEWEALVACAVYARDAAAEAEIALTQCVTTNGTRLTKDRARALGDLDVYVGLSIDGNQRAHEANRPTMGGGSSYGEVSSALDRLVDEGRAFETISVMTPASVGELGASAAELFARGVPRLTLNPCYEAIWTDGDLARWERGLEQTAEVMAAWMRRGRVVSVSAFDDKIRGRGRARTDAEKCGLGLRAIAVAPSGNVYPCERFVGEDEDHALVIGHVERGIDAARVRELHARMPGRHARNDDCASCEERGRCGAFCACANYAETGRIEIAGGVQCWYERTAMRIGDALADALAGTNAFVEHFGPLPAPPSARRVAHAIPRADVRRLPVVRG